MAKADFDMERHDPALVTRLELIGKDIAAGKNLNDLPPGLAEALIRIMDEVFVDLIAPLEGDVSL